MSLDDVAIFLLNFSHATIIAPLIVIGFLAINRKIYGQGLCVLILSLFVNCLLKFIFGIPLSPHLNISGYAFPSGHMQSSTVIYGWLLIHSRSNLLKALLLLLLIGIGYSLIKQGYHNFYDVLGGVFFAATIIAIFYFFANTNLIKRLPSLLGIIALPIMILVKIYLTKINYSVSSYFEIGIWSVAGFSICWLILNRNISERPYLNQAILAITCFAASITAIYFIYPDLLIGKSFHKCSIVCSLMPISAAFGGKFFNLKKLKLKRFGQQNLTRNLSKLTKEIIKQNIT